MLAAEKVSGLHNFRLFIIRNIFEIVVDLFFLYYAVLDYRYFGQGLKEMFFPEARSRDILVVEDV